MTGGGNPVPPLPPLAIIGLGRMGRAVDELATSGGWPVRARLDAADAPLSQEKLAGASVAIDFTVGHSVPATVRACLAAGCAIVVGTTGWYNELSALRSEVEGAGGAMLWAPNFSIGAAALVAAAVHAARVLAKARTFGFTYHRGAPSGEGRRAVGYCARPQHCRRQSLWRGCPDHQRPNRSYAGRPRRDFRCALRTDSALTYRARPTGFCGRGSGWRRVARWAPGRIYHD